MAKPRKKEKSPPKFIDGVAPAEPKDDFARARQICGTGFHLPVLEHLMSHGWTYDYKNKSFRYAPVPYSDKPPTDDDTFLVSFLAKHYDYGKGEWVQIKR